MALERMGHEAESKSSALTALEMAQARPPDLALFDYLMPGVDGVTLFGAMRAALGDRCPKVLFISAAAEEVEENLTPAASVVGYVQKPFHFGDLSPVVTERWPPRMLLIAPARACVATSALRPKGKGSFLSRESVWCDCGRALRALCGRGGGSPMPRPARCRSG